MEAWAAWKAATRFLLWALVERVTRAISVRKVAMRELTAFNPAAPKDLFACGYAVFINDINFDSWRGYWRPADAERGVPYDAEFEVIDWSYVPWRKVEFTDAHYTGLEVRAVSLDYCRRNLNIGQRPLKAVA